MVASAASTFFASNSEAVCLSHISTITCWADVRPASFYAFVLCFSLLFELQPVNTKVDAVIAARIVRILIIASILSGFSRIPRAGYTANKLTTPLSSPSQGGDEKGGKR